MGRAEKDLEYLKYQFSIFEPFCSKGIVEDSKKCKKNNKIYKGYKLRTRSLDIFLDYYNIWYPNGKKIVPFNFELTPTTLATWFCDDGSVSFKNGRNKIKYKTSLRLKISTNSFTKEEVEFLLEKLNTTIGNYFNIYHDSLNWYKKKNPSYIENNNINYYIMTYTDGADKLFEYIKDFFPQGMERKLNVWKEFSNGRLVATNS